MQSRRNRGIADAHDPERQQPLPVLPARGVELRGQPFLAGAGLGQKRGTLMNLASQATPPVADKVPVGRVPCVRRPTKLFQRPAVERGLVK